MSVNESAERIEELIHDVDDNNLNLKNDIVQIEEDLEKLELEKKKANPRSYRQVPGDELHKLMEKWGKDHLYEPEEIMEYADCLWISLEKYENQLKLEEKGF